MVHLRYVTREVTLEANQTLQAQVELGESEPVPKGVSG